jgi:hypothetical protein
MATVEYGKTFNLGNYENERIFLTDDVQPGETQDEAYARVRHWVLAKHGEGEELLSLEQQRRRAQSRADQAQYGLSNVVSQWREAVLRFEALRELLAKHGVELRPLDPYYLPPKEQPETVLVPSADEEEEDEEDNGI